MQNQALLSTLTKEAGREVGWERGRGKEKKEKETIFFIHVNKI